MCNYSDLGEYRFVSINEQGEIGSVYYKNGRIRLVHDNGPKISLNTQHGNRVVDRFHIPKGKGYTGDSFTGKSRGNIKTAIEANGGIYLKVAPEEWIKDFTLLEIFTSPAAPNQYLGRHKSRGCAVSMTLPSGTEDKLKNVFDYINSKGQDVINESNLKVKTLLGNCIKTYSPAEIAQTNASTPNDGSECCCGGCLLI